MRSDDLELLQRIAEAMEQYFPYKEKVLVEDFLALCERARNQKEKRAQAYKDKAQYYRDYVRKWKADNPDKQKEYAARYLEKKKGGT